MTDEKTTSPETSTEDGKVLPAREMMSLVGTDPVDPTFAAMVPPPTEEIGGPYSQSLPLPADSDVEDGNSESTSTTVESSDSASAG